MKKLFILTMFFMVFLIGSVGAITWDPISCWQLNDNLATTNVIDAIGSNDGTANKNTNLLSTTGIIDEAFEFDGAADYFSTADAPFDWGDGDDFTLGAWYKNTSAMQNGNIFHKYSGKGYYLSIKNAAGYVDFTSWNATTAYVLDSTAPIPYGAWNLIVAVRNGTSMSLYINGALNDTKVQGQGDVTGTSDLYVGRASHAASSYLKDDLDETFVFDRALSATDISDIWDGGTGESCGLVDFPPVVTLLSPPDAEVFLGEAIQTITFNGSATDDQTLDNISIFGNWNGGWHLNATNASVFNNTETKFSNLLPSGTYIWNYYACDNASQCSYAATNRTFTIATFIDNGVTFNATTLETDTESFFLNITTNGTAPTNGKLIYNGTSYTATITNIAGNVYNISRTIDIPTTAENKSFLFNFTLGSEINTGLYNQTVNLTNFTNVVSGVPFINVSFKNETLAQEAVTATISSDWYYWLGSGDVIKTLSFTDAGENAYYTFLLAGVNRTLHTNTTISYTNSISQQRTYTDAALDLTNTTTDLTLFLLPTSEGIFVTFQVINIAQQPLSGVFSNVSLSGSLIASGTTDDAGSITYFLDPDTSYTFYFEKSGFNTQITTFAPSQTTYTITLSQAGGDVIEDYTQGINYSISPGQVSLTNDTLTFFNFSLNSSFWTVNTFGFNLTNQDGIIVNASDASTSGGTVFVYHNVSNDTSLTMNYFWNITGNFTRGSFTWVVFDGTGTGFGLTTFFTRVTTYLSEGIFGLNTNSMVILIYLIIFISVGIMSLKFGIRSPATIVMVLFGLSFLFEVHLELIPSVGGVPLLTTILGIVVVIALIREYLKI